MELPASTDAAKGWNVHVAFQPGPRRFSNALRAYANEHDNAVNITMLWTGRAFRNCIYLSNPPSIGDAINSQSCVQKHGLPGLIGTLVGSDLVDHLTK